ncbi:50S ribosomal protein L30e-like protein [Glomus cerebriforme]|uniref:H/ACA ribonucleoprotein complex subunit 2 n=1 Tax=Glomus cerebriforme TaxID=658196 RepID=A0A397T9X4_9GLOM|nr:50S ribosomal protein L30e-like protein [Glomus cerebriforme]
MPKEKKESKSKKEKKEKSHKKREKHSSKNKDTNAMEVDVISPVSVESTPTLTPVKTKTDKGLIVHYDLRALIPFAQPLASEELTREIMKVIRIAARKRHCRRGVKETVKAICKKQKGLVVMAGDVSPMDVISHIPVLCEDHEIHYVFIPSRADLGFSCATKRPTSVIMIVPDCKIEENNLEYREILEKVLVKVKELEQFMIH